MTEDEILAMTGKFCVKSQGRGGGNNTMMAYTRGGSTRKGNLFQASGICKGVDFTC